MLRAVTAAFLSIPLILPLTSLAEAGSGHRRVERAGGSGFATDSPRHAWAAPAAIAPERRAPVVGPTRFATDPVWASSGPTVITFGEPRMPRPVRPLSVNAVDPNAVVGRTPSGRVFIGPAPGAYIATPEEVAHYRRIAQPYAQPSFQFLGATSSRDLQSPVKLTHGVRPPETLATGPKVVWLDGSGAEINRSGENPHVKHLK